MNEFKEGFKEGFGLIFNTEYLGVMCALFLFAFLAGGVVAFASLLVYKSGGL